MKLQQISTRKYGTHVSLYKQPENGVKTVRDARDLGLEMFAIHTVLKSAILYDFTFTLAVFKCSDFEVVYYTHYAAMPA